MRQESISPNVNEPGRSTYSGTSPQEQPDPRRWISLTSVMVAIFMATLDSGVVNVALPTISSSFQTPLPTAQWIVTSYLLTISSLLPAFGRLADIWGRKRVYTIGFLIFIFGSATCSVATNMAFLIVGRIVQAVGASMIMANTQAISMSLFPANERGRALGFNGAVAALGSVTGPSLGGFLVDALGWQSVFWLNLPIGIVAFYIGQKLLPERLNQANRGSFDWLGAALFATAIVSLMLGLSHGNSWGWLSVLTVGVLGYSVSAFTLFVVWETRRPHPMVDLSIFRIPTFTFGTIAALLSFFSLFSSMVILPFYLERVLGLSPSQVGLVLTPYPLMLGLVAPLSGWIADRTQSLAHSSAGLIINGLGLAYLSTLNADSSPLSVAMRVALLGIGQGFFQSPNSTAVLSSVPRESLGVAGSLNALMRNIGSVLGVTITIAVFDAIHGQVISGALQPLTGDEAHTFLYPAQMTLRMLSVVAFTGAIIAWQRGTTIRR